MLGNVFSNIQGPLYVSSVEIYSISDIYFSNRLRVRIDVSCSETTGSFFYGTLVSTVILLSFPGSGVLNSMLSTSASRTNISAMSTGLDNTCAITWTLCRYIELSSNLANRSQRRLTDELVPNHLKLIPDSHGARFSLHRLLLPIYVDLRQILNFGSETAAVSG